MHRVVAVAVPNVVAFDLSIVAQLFGHPDERDRYSFRAATLHPGIVPTTTGFGIAVAAGLGALRDADTVIVPGFRPLDDPPMPVLDALREASARGARIASVCVGAFALAAAGLLDGRAATTHWQEADAFRARFPRVRLNADVLYVDEGRILTSAGISAGIDLCLHMMRLDHGAAVADAAARRMVVAGHRPGGQAQYVARPDADDPLTRTYEWALAELGRPLSISQLARHAAMSERSFARRFAERTGMTPMRWLAAQRVLEAQRLLEVTDLGVDEIARRSGLGTASNLRLHLDRSLGTTPTEYRAAHRRS